ncbi:hypothetical protein EVAR_6932_1 [Eumeta japonica]|uniref:Uncharacterized protein n=1 Tax=Eumeta variegata TaxID=151549 RepID=A0A4C1TGF3_EUMVA|nr:hypothetical protein EVAR_6932_1 [Eumeta japonica]
MYRLYVLHLEMVGAESGSTYGRNRKPDHDKERKKDRDRQKDKHHKHKDYGDCAFDRFFLFRQEASQTYKHRTSREKDMSISVDDPRRARHWAKRIRTNASVVNGVLDHRREHGHQSFLEGSGRGRFGFRDERVDDITSGDRIFTGGDILGVVQIDRGVTGPRSPRPLGRDGLTTPKVGMPLARATPLQLRDIRFYVMRGRLCAHCSTVVWRAEPV